MEAYDQIQSCVRTIEKDRPHICSLCGVTSKSSTIPAIRMAVVDCANLAPLSTCGKSSAGIGTYGASAITNLVVRSLNNAYWGPGAVALVAASFRNVARSLDQRGRAVLGDKGLQFLPRHRFEIEIQFGNFAQKLCVPNGRHEGVAQVFQAP